MRRIFKGRIKWVILTVVIIVLLASIPFIVGYINKDNNKSKSDITINEKNKTELKEEKKEEQEIVEDKVEESIDVEEKTTTNNTPKPNNSNSSSNNSKPNNSTSNKTTNSNNTNIQNNQTTVSNDSKENNTGTNSNSNVPNNTEPPKQTQPQPSEDLTKVANPNDFFYSITGGEPEFSTNSGCMNAGDDIAFMGVVDVQYFRCYEVMSKANTIMGYYLNIFCESGNCNNRYKSMIDISSYD